MALCDDSMWDRAAGFNGYVAPETEHANTVLSVGARGRRGQPAGDAGEQKLCPEYLIASHYCFCVCLLPAQ